MWKYSGGSGRRTGLQQPTADLSYGTSRWSLSRSRSPALLSGWAVTRRKYMQGSVGSPMAGSHTFTRPSPLRGAGIGYSNRPDRRDGTIVVLGIATWFLFDWAEAAAPPEGTWK